MAEVLLGLSKLIMSAGATYFIVKMANAASRYVDRATPASDISAGVSTDKQWGGLFVGFQGHTSHAQKKDHSVVPALNGHVDE